MKLSNEAPFRPIRYLSATVLGLLLAACGGGGGDAGSGATGYTIGGSISGLTGTLVLQNNGGDNLSRSADGSFSFPTQVNSGSSYDITVLTQPAGQSCMVNAGSGSASGDVADISVVCTTETAWTGIKQFGASGLDTHGAGIAVDGNGGVYVTGFTAGGLDGNSLTGLQDVFLTKYSSGGSKQFTKQLGVTGHTLTGNGVAVDASGNVYVVGSTDGALGGNSLTGTQDFFLLKYNSSGVKQYAKQLGAANAVTNGQSVAVDGSGNVYVAGSTTGGLDGNTLTGTWDLFLTKYDSSGVKQYTKQMGVSGKVCVGWSVAVDGGGNVYVAGYTNGGLDGNPPTGTYDYFVTKLDGNGNVQSMLQSGVAQGTAYAHAVAVDAAGNIFISGYTTGNLHGNTLKGWDDQFVTKYDVNGIRAYTQLLGALDLTTTGQALALDASGNVYLTGNTWGYQGGLDGSAVRGTQDLFMTKYGNAGAPQFVRELGVTNTISSGEAIATDATGNVYVTGFTGGGLGGNTLAGSSDAFVIKYDGSGVQQ